MCARAHNGFIICLKITKKQAMQKTDYYYLSVEGCTVKAVSEKVYHNNRVSALEKLVAMRAADKFQGDISENSRKKIMKYTKAWCSAVAEYNYYADQNGIKSKRKFVMITLTLSGSTGMCDNEVKRVLLNSFLTKLRLKYKDFLYLWRAEKQKNGRIHFHIIVDKFMNKTWILDNWNAVQRKHNIIPYVPLSQERKQFPSTRIEAIRTESGALSYVAKYITKNDSELYVNGRCWSCSRELKLIHPYTVRVNKSAIESTLSELGCVESWRQENDLVRLYKVNNRFRQSHFIELFESLRYEVFSRPLDVYLEHLQASISDNNFDTDGGLVSQSLFNAL